MKVAEYAALTSGGVHENYFPDLAVWAYSCVFVYVVNQADIRISRTKPREQRVFQHKVISLSVKLVAFIVRCLIVCAKIKQVYIYFINGTQAVLGPYAKLRVRTPSLYLVFLDCVYMQLLVRYMSTSQQYIGEKLSCSWRSMRPNVTNQGTFCLKLN